MSNYSNLEKGVSILMSKFPKFKKFIKIAYQSLNWLLYKKNYLYKSEYNIIEIDNTNKSSFFGYYDKSPENESGNKIIYHRTNLNTKNKPSPNHSIEIVLKCLESDTISLIDKTYSYNWQQGSKMMWLSNDKFIYNVYSKALNKYQSKIYNIKKKEFKIIDWPIYDCYNDEYALCLNFNKLRDLRPDYGYRNLNEYPDYNDYSNDGIYKVSLKNNSCSLLISIQELIDDVNKDPRRGYGHENVLTQITVNELTELIIKDAGYTLESIIPNGEKLNLKDTANLSTGGTAEDITDIIHPANVSMAERISKIIDLDICGIDIATTDISKPLSETGGAVLEVNAGPGFRMHLAPTTGLPRNVAAPVIEKLFPQKGDTGSIPIVAISGTNGKTTTTRLIAHIAKMRGYRVGYTTSDGVYIQNRLLMTGDCTGPASSEFVLRDPTVNFAVLECARGGLLRAGLTFKKCDVAVVTNVEADHLGLKGIHTIEQLAKVKAVVPETVKADGYAILNADDDLVYDMRRNLDCNVALFSMDENNPRIKALQRLNGITAIYENGFITICRGEWKMRLMIAENIPLTYGGKAKFMIKNVLGATLAAHVQGISNEDIKAALETFIPSSTQTPGRLNLFKFNDFNILLDYAHNPAGMLALKDFVDQLDATVKVGIIAGIGDRRLEDNNEMGSIAAEMFDEIIIRQDKRLRGKTEEEIIKMLDDGIKMKDPNKKTIIIPSEHEAITYAVKNAVKGSLIILCSDVIPDALALVEKFKEQESKGELVFND